MATLQDSRSQLNVGTEMTGYPPAGIPVGPVNDPITADNRPSPQVPAPVIVSSLLPTPTNSPTNLTLTWVVNLNVTDSLGWSNTAPSPAPQPNPNLSGYKQSWIDQWTSPYVNPADPVPDSFNIYQVIRDKYSASPTYVFVKNVAASLPGPQTTTLPLPSPTAASITEYTVTAVKNTSGSYVGGEGPFPAVSLRGGLNPQYVVPKPVDIVVVTNPGNQSNNLSDTVSLQITASDTTSGTLNYTASGLPTGLTLNLTSGLITGTVTAMTGVPAAVRVTVQNMSTGAVGVQDFTWMVSAPPVPNAPTGLGSSSVTSTGATLSWTAPSGGVTPTGYNVYDNTSGTPAKLNGSPLTATTYNVTGVTGAPVSKTYYVTALNGVSESVGSQPLSVSYPAPAPNGPTAVAGTTPASHQSTISWTAPGSGPTPTGYYVYSTTGGVTTKSALLPASPLTYLFTGTASASYTFTVSAVNQGTEGAQSTASSSVGPF